MLCLSTLVLLSFFTPVQEIPYKPQAEFEVKVDLQFKPRHAPSTTGTEVPVYQIDKTKDKLNGAPKAYVFLDVNLLKLQPTEVRCKGASGVTAIYNKKVKQGSVIRIEVGFVDEVKEKLQSRVYQLTFFDDNKKASTRIVLTIEPDGLYLINGQKAGKF